MLLSEKKCEICGKLFIGKNKSCSKKCMYQLASITRKKTNLAKYGVENAAKSEIVKRKAKETCLERYGFVSPMQNETIQSKSRQTCFKNYGVTNPAFSPLVLKKIEESNLEKYGVPCSFQSEKVKATYAENYLKNHGVMHPFSDKIVQEKRKKTCLKKYGGGNRKLNPNKLKEMIKYAKENGCSYATVAKKFNVSAHCAEINLKSAGITPGNITCPEQQIIDLIKTEFLGLEFIVHDRQAIKPQEIDILFPSLKLGIEVNGIYWHKDAPKNYHFSKYAKAKQKNIDILMIECDHEINEELLPIIKDVLNKRLTYAI